eukprot:6182309-Pleurochrysis_carterae.AAC.4
MGRAPHMMTVDLEGKRAAALCAPRRGMSKRVFSSWFNARAGFAGRPVFCATSLFSLAGAVAGLWTRTGQA